MIQKKEKFKDKVALWVRQMWHRHVSQKYFHSKNISFYCCTIRVAASKAKADVDKRKTRHLRVGVTPDGVGTKPGLYKRLSFLFYY